MFQEILAYFCGILLIVSSIFSFAAAIGMLRLPDLYTRMHAASKAGTLGSGLALITIAIYSLNGSVVMRALAGVLFLLLTAPISAHLLAKAAYVAGYRPDDSTFLNEMEDSTTRHS